MTTTRTSLVFLATISIILLVSLRAAGAQESLTGALQRCRDAVAPVVGRDTSTTAAANVCRDERNRARAANQYGGQDCWNQLQKAISETGLASSLERTPRKGPDNPYPALAEDHRRNARQTLVDADSCIASLKRAGATAGTAATTPGARAASGPAATHPGQKWGYASVYPPSRYSAGQRSDSSQDFTVKVPDSVPNGGEHLQTTQSGSMALGFYTEVKGIVRRGAGDGGSDVFEITALHQRGGQWETYRAQVPLTH
jgi:hypothetical protein